MITSYARRSSDAVIFWIFLAIIAAIVFFPQACLAEDLKKCMLSCENTELYGKPVKQCLYDEMKKCAPRQQPCIDTETVYCKPRMVNLGEWNVVYNDKKSDSGSWTFH